MLTNEENTGKYWLKYQGRMIPGFSGGSGGVLMEDASERRSTALRERKH